MTIAHQNRKHLRTSLYDRHIELGARMVEFSGYELPIYYTGIIDEHLWVRSACGLFDVSHLGEIRVTGRGAFPFLEKMVPSDLAKIGDGQILYTTVLNESGGIIDDILIYRVDMSSFYLVVNASRIAKVFNHLNAYVSENVDLSDESFRAGCVAIQGPEAALVVERMFGKDVCRLSTYSFMPLASWGKSAWVSRTGYTGEDGFEVFADPDTLVKIWDELMSQREKLHIQPIGLGARNTLRLEVGNVLNGSDMDETKTPYEARLAWIVSPTKRDFVGRDKLFERKIKGFRHRLCGFKLHKKSVAREGHMIWKGDRKIGVVTSGSFSPTLEIPIGLGYVETAFSNPDTDIEVEVHHRRVQATIVRLPFVPIRRPSIS